MLIKAAKGPDEARSSLISRFEFSEIQAQAILEMRLQRLTGLERDKIIEEYKQVLALIEELKKILSSEKLVFEVIKKELLEVREKYADKRRTEIVLNELQEFEAEDLIADEEALVSITHTSATSSGLTRTSSGRRAAAARASAGSRPATRTS